MMRVSVIIPARDRAEILPETLRALARQSFPSGGFEVVVVDDGSTDGTEALLRAADLPFRLVYERLERREDFCPARPRNRGLDVATGEIALFLDADVLAAPGLVAAHVAAHAAVATPRAVIGYTYGYPLAPEERAPHAMQAPPAERLLEELPGLLTRDEARWGDGREPIYAATGDLTDHPAPWQLFWTTNVSLPRGLAQEVGGFDEQFVGWGVEDLELAYRLHRHGVPFVLVREAAGVHWPHPVPDLGARRVAMERNRRRLIAKHPGPELELRLWDARACADAWQAVARLRDLPPRDSAAGLRALAVLFEHLETHVLPSGPLLWCGPAPAALDARRRPAAWCLPFPSEAEASQAALPLLGVYTPWEDASFAGALVWDEGPSLPSDLRLAQLREAVRVAGGAALLGAGEDAWGAPLAGPGEERAVCAAVSPDCAWESVRLGDARVLLVYRPSWRGKRMRLVIQKKLPSTNGHNGPVPMAIAVAATVTRALQERRQIDALAATVLQRLREQAATAPEEEVPAAATNGASSPAADLRLPDLEPSRTPDAEPVAPIEAPPPEPAPRVPQPALELDMAPWEAPPSRPAGAHPLVAPLGTRDQVLCWQGRLARKPWEYRITAVIPHLETPEPLRAAVELLRLQTERPYLLVIDTGSSDSVKAALEAMRAEDLEVHMVAAHGYLHSSEAVGVAQDLAFALCRSEYLFCTHADCFLRRRNYVEWLLGLCSPETPVVGYEMSSRDWLTDQWEGMVSHTATLLHMPTMHRLGVSWSFERAHVQFGIPRSSPAWPDTETCMNLVLRQAGVQPLLIGQEENYRRHVDENLDHVRSFPGAQVYAVEYYARAQAWMEEALRDAWQRVSLWRAAALRN
jgi:GT2 family glycosyltransferase